MKNFIVLDGKLDVVIEWRKKDWSCRAWGISFGQWFFGWVVFKKISEQEAGQA